MRRAVIIAGIATFVLSVSLAGGHALARTPTPTVTPTATPSPAMPTLTLRPPDDQLASFGGLAWVDARVSTGPVIAKIGDQTCGEAKFLSPPCDPACTIIEYYLDVPSDQVKPGCGYEGAAIIFFVEGKQAPQTAIWHAPSQTSLTLTAGPPFSRFWGYFQGSADLPILNYPYSEEKSVLIPYVGDVACGYDDYFWCDRSGGCAYGAVIYSSQQRPGCGYEGAPVTFRLVDSQRNVVAASLETGVWNVWDGTDGSSEQLNLTMVPVADIGVGSMGGGGSGGNGAPFDVVLGLALAGVATLATGVALRKRASQRDRARVREG